MIVLDTDVTSELVRSAPADAVVEWLRRHSAADLFTTSITLAEIVYGINRLPVGRRRDLLVSAATEVFTQFAEPVLDFDPMRPGTTAT